MQLAKIEYGELITTYAEDTDREMINTMIADGFKVFVEEEQPMIPLSEFQSQELHHREESHQITSYYEVLDNSPEKITVEIERLKTELSATDYKVVKSYEYTLAGTEPPYDLPTLHSERQQLREQINLLKQKLPTK